VVDFCDYFVLNNYINEELESISLFLGFTQYLAVASAAQDRSSPLWAEADLVLPAAFLAGYVVLLPLRP
jgi:hypothetical protein